MLERILRSKVITLALLAACAAAAQQAGQPATRGVTGKPLTTLEFADDLPNLAGQAMRMRRVEIAPGGGVDTHSHRGRPAVLYIVTGSIVERRGGAQRTYSAGDSYAIGGDTTHAIDNPGAAPAIYIEVDIVPVAAAR
ncbi:MAG: cupin domain-containing protein [Sterolibacteriaceae bacterium]|nr:cupin domain-containing protein [Candidatus Methylophosphatis haderslevensis]